MKLWHALTCLFRRRRLEAEMAEEMRLHLEARIQENITAGLSPDEARYAALRKFGHVTGIQEQVRDGRRWLWLEQGIQDLRYAMRTLAKAPGFTAAATFTLALGIGANTAMFSVIYGVLIAPYPYAKPGEIWAPEVTDATTGRFSGSRFADYVEMSKLPAVDSAMATRFGSAVVSGEFAPEVVTAPRVTGSAFGFLDVPPILGRGLTPGDVRANGDAEPVTVLSFQLWQRLFGGSLDVLDRRIVLDDVPHAIVGVMPPRFGWYTNDGLWLPMAQNHPNQGVRPIVRLKPGVTPEVAGQQLTGLVEELIRQDPARFPKDGFRARFVNYLNITVASGAMKDSLQLLFVAVGFLLLIACTNVANLQLARAAGRGREIAVRLAIGASRGRMVRQLLIESIVLSAAGGVIGVALAAGLTKAIVWLMPEFYVPNEARITLNLWVLAFSAGVSVFTGVLFGLVPAWQCTKPDLNSALKDGGSSVGGRQGNRTRGTLVIVQVALSVVLLVGAGLAVQSFVTLQRVDRGVQSGRTLIVRLPLSPERYPSVERRNGFMQEYLEKVRAVPGVEAAAIGTLAGFEAGTGVTVPGREKTERVDLSFVGDRYFDVLGIRVRRGRVFTEPDVLGAARLVVINEAGAKHWFGSDDPLGRVLSIDALVGGNASNLPIPGVEKEVTIIGVVADTRTRFNDLTREITPAVFVPHTLRGLTNRALVVKAGMEPASVFNTLRGIVRGLDADQPVDRFITVEQILARQVVQPRFILALFSALAGIAVLLAATGLYSVLSYSVSRRTREIGVRMALGAAHGAIIRFVLGSGLRLLLAGLGTGLTVSLMLAELVKSRVFNVPVHDPAVLAAVVILLGLAAMLASWLPARRAARIDPIIALRAE